jgi:16S rRNA processing protein RimM
VVGRVLRPHGVHGEVKVRPETDFPERFARLREVLVRRDDRTEVRTVEGVRWQGAVALVKLAGVEDPEAARALAGADLLVPWEARVPLPPGTYYVGEVLGLTVRTTAGEVLGTVTEVLRGAAHDVYRVTGPEAEVLLPAIRPVVRAIDPAAGTMTVEVPPDLPTIRRRTRTPARAGTPVRAATLARAATPARARAPGRSRTPA